MVGMMAVSDSHRQLAVVSVLFAIICLRGINPSFISSSPLASLLALHSRPQTQPTLRLACND